MTGISDTESKVKGLELGAVDYIIKPFQAEELLARIKSHLQLRNLTKTLESRVDERTAELSQALKELQEFQIQLIQTEKMSSLGNLIAGIAHEINNPMGFIASNLQPAREHLQDLFHIIDLYQKYYPHPEPKLVEEMSNIDIDYLRSDLPNLIASMQEGVHRIRDITNSLRNFSRADGDHQVACNIHDGLNSTLMILKHRLKASTTRPDIQVIKDYGVNLPLVNCFTGQLNQVFINLLANAIDALEESIHGRSFSEIQANPQQIYIQTKLTEDEKHLLIRVQDNGVGISPEIQSKVFDYLFTTKAVNQGTGLGLSIARQIIVEKHGGTLAVNSQLGKGSEFIITLPIKKDVDS
jgi:signal transduction histidine kinase